MQVSTISHFKLMEFIDEKFDLLFVKVKFTNDEEVTVIDHYNKSITFYLHNGKVNWRDDVPTKDEKNSAHF